MPELPEVETIRRGLKGYIVGQKLRNTTILCAKSFIGEPITGKVTAIRRFGKALIIDFDNGKSLMIHLRMTGQLIYDANSKPASKSSAQSTKNRFAAGHPSDNFTATLPNKQTRVVLEFMSGTLYFNDQRKFGFIKSLETTEVMDDSFIQKLAPEPWSMAPEEFYKRLQKHPKSCVKATILDQSIICGLGNIYADEALFDAKIHPERKSGTITREESNQLLKSACNVMDNSIASGGSTMQTYVKADGTKGDYLELFAQVFHRQNQPCPRCGHSIKKIKVAGRGTHLCPHCQTIPLDAKSHQPHKSQRSFKK